MSLIFPGINHLAIFVTSGNDPCLRLYTGYYYLWNAGSNFLPNALSVFSHSRRGSLLPPASIFFNAPAASAGVARLFFHYCGVRVQIFSEQVQFIFRPLVNNLDFFGWKFT
jgi:hypothetical protein